MCTPSYLFSRGGIFCFRIAIPARLRPALSGLTEFRGALFTQDKKALTKSWILSIQSQRIFEPPFRHPNSSRQSMSRSSPD